MYKSDEIFEERLNDIEAQYDEIVSLLESNEIITDNKLFNYYLKQKNEIEEISLLIKKRKQAIQSLLTNQELLSIETDGEQKRKIIEDSTTQEKIILECDEKLKVILFEMQISENQKVLVEVSSKTATDRISVLKNILNNYAQNSGLKFESASFNEKKMSAKFSGVGAYEKLKTLSGQIKFVNRGVEEMLTLVVLKSEIEIPEIKEEDIKVQTLKSGGAGGQHINKTESAVRLIHIPTGITVECEDERSQTANRAKAFERLKLKIAKVYEENNKNDTKKQRDSQKNAIFSDTAKIIFDYDKNIVKTISGKTYKLKDILNGELDLLISEL